MKKSFPQTLEIKSISKEGAVFTGYASVFNKPDSTGDIILPGAFAETLRDNYNRNIKLLWQHDPENPIGYLTEIRETIQGLYVEGNIITELPKGMDVYKLINKKVIDGLSIGFEVVDCFYNSDIRYIKKIKLWEVSIVTFPANVHARIDNVELTTHRIDGGRY
jgi:uncharacterized protein